MQKIVSIPVDCISRTESLHSVVYSLKHPSEDGGPFLLNLNPKLPDRIDLWAKGVPLDIKLGKRYVLSIAEEE